MIVNHPWIRSQRATGRVAGATLRSLRRAARFATFVLLAIPGMGWAFGAAPDDASYPPPAYDEFVPPPSGGAYVDPVFGTTIRRLSDAQSTPNAMGGGSLRFISGEYATMTPFNQDQTRILLQHQSYYGLYDGEAGYIRDLPYEISASSEPRWSRSDPNVLYYIVGNELRSYDIADDRVDRIRRFDAYARVGGNGESDIGFDGDRFVLAGDGRYVFVYTISTDTAGPVLDTIGHPFDSLYITPDNHVTVTYYTHGSDRFNGIELYDANMNFLRQVATAGGHMDVTRDVDGEEVLVWANSGDALADPACPNGVVKIRLADAVRTCLLSLDWNLAIHVSATDQDGWAFVGTYAPANPDPSGLWAPYTNELLQVRLDGSEVRRLAHHRSRPYESYVYTPKMSASRDGTKVIFNSNYGQQALTALPVEYTDAYLIDLAGTASPGPSGPPPSEPDPQPAPEPEPEPEAEDGGPQTSTGQIIRYEDSDAAVTRTGTWMENKLSVHSGGSAILAVDPGSATRLDFTGSGVSWIGYADEWSGTARVYLDGELRDTVDAYRSPGQAGVELYSIDGLATGDHTLVIEATGKESAASAGAWIWIDAIDVVSGPPEASPGPAAPEPTPEPSPESGGDGAASVGRYEEDHAAVTTTGTWMPNGLAVHSGNGALMAVDAGASARFDFAGTGAQWIGYSDEWSGTADVYLDGEYRASVDTYRSPAAAENVLFSIADLPEGNHTLVVEATGSHGASSAGSWIWIDAFDVISASSGVSVDLGSDAPVPVPVAGSPDQEAVRFEEYDASVGFRGQWAANALPVHSDGAARLSTNTGARTSFLFAGTGVRWIGVGDPWSGIARIYVDGELVTTADTYRETETFGLELATVVGLDPGMHELEIEVTGQKNPLSGGIGIWVDAFDVQPTGSTVLCEGGGSALAGSSSSGAAPVSESTVKEAVVSAATMVVEESDTAVQYAGSWHINNLAVHSGQQAAMAMDTGAQATFSFVGTGADWFGYSDGWSGIAEILVDGVTVGTVDTYDAAGSARTALYSVRDLPAGPHSLTVRVTGRQNPESGGSWIWIDGFGQR